MHRFRDLTKMHQELIEEEKFGPVTFAQFKRAYTYLRGKRKAILKYNTEFFQDKERRTEYFIQLDQQVAEEAWEFLAIAKRRYRDGNGKASGEIYAAAAMLKVLQESIRDQQELVGIRSPKGTINATFTANDNSQTNVTQIMLESMKRAESITTSARPVVVEEPRGPGILPPGSVEEKAGTTPNQDMQRDPGQPEVGDHVLSQPGKDVHRGGNGGVVPDEPSPEHRDNNGSNGQPSETRDMAGDPGPPRAVLVNCTTTGPMPDDRVGDRT